MLYFISEGQKLSCGINFILNDFNAYFNMKIIFSLGESVFRYNLRIRKLSFGLRYMIISNFSKSHKSQWLCL